jgi:methyl-accepting chemotaxis protein
MRKLGLAANIYLVLSLLIVLAATIAAIGINTIWTYEQRVQEIQLASQRGMLGKDANGLVLQIVMDSRGIYMARDRAESEKFARPVLENLKKLRTTMATWEAIVPEPGKSKFEAGKESVEQFINFRTELVRLSRETSLAEARAYGDNDANRENRKQLNDDLNALADKNSYEVAAITAALNGFYQTRLWIMVITALIGISGIATLCIVIVGRVITAPIRNVIATMIRLAGGDTSAKIPYLDFPREIGDMARAVDVFKISMLETERLRFEHAQERERAQARRDADMQRIANEFQVTVGHVIDAVSSASIELEAVASSLTHTAETTTALSATVESASHDASMSVQSVASATEELSACIDEIGGRIQESAKIAGEAVAQVGATDARIAKLSEAAERIGGAIKLITAIAGQTNLLALNATIEAARAGESGKGFAVVAYEVKALAAQTAKAADEIGMLISGIQTATQDSVAAINAIGSTICRVSEITEIISHAIEKQSEATEDISRNIQQAAAGASQVAANIKKVSRGAGETGSASVAMFTSAQSLAKEGQHLKTEVEKFLSMVKAG